jgi:hypothetical protein
LGGVEEGGFDLMVKKMGALLLILPGLAFGGEAYYGAGLGVGYSNPQLEGSVDDLTENEFKRVKANENTRFSYAGRLFVGQRMGTVFAEVGYAVLGKWSVWTKDNRINGEVSARAGYAVVGKSFGNLDVYGGMHRHKVVYKLKQKTQANKRNKERYHEVSVGPLYGVRYNWERIAVRGEFWKSLGTHERVGKSYVGTVSVGVYFD